MSKVRKRTILSTGTYDHTKVKYEKNSGKSLTEPNKALSIPQIVERYRSGRPVVEHEPIYSDHDIPDVAHMDYADQEEFVRLHDEKRKELEAEIAASKRKPKPKQLTESDESVSSNEEDGEA